MKKIVLFIIIIALGCANIQAQRGRTTPMKHAKTRSSYVHKKKTKVVHNQHNQYIGKKWGRTGVAVLKNDSSSVYSISSVVPKTKKQHIQAYTNTWMKSNERKWLYENSLSYKETDVSQNSDETSINAFDILYKKNDTIFQFEPD